MAPLKTVQEKLVAVTAGLRADKKIEVLVEPPKEAYIQAALARGDRRLGAALLAAHARGGVKAWARALEETGLSGDFYLYRERDPGELLPWQHLDMGLSPDYLHQEFARALEETYTPPCRPGCALCGVCRPGRGEKGGTS